MTISEGNKDYTEIAKQQGKLNTLHHDFIGMKYGRCQ